MENEFVNRSILCNVQSCKNHCSKDNFCSLECICVGTHESDPAMNQCTDCRSFVNKNYAEQRSAVRTNEIEKQCGTSSC